MRVALNTKGVVMLPDASTRQGPGTLARKQSRWKKDRLTIIFG
jgi:hypothetical protein